MYDLIIVGAGPAGLTAAIYARRADKKVLVLEAKSYGGQIINTTDIENYPALSHVSGFDFADNLYNQVVDLGAEIKFEKVIEIKNLDSYKEVITNNNVYKTKSIIIATGVKQRKLGLDNEEKLIGRGISYCATCDGAFYKSKNVAVVGGGNTALEDSLYLSELANVVYLIHRREDFRGEFSLVNRLREKKNVVFILNSNIKKINGNDQLKSIDVVDNFGKVSTLQIDGLFVAIGQVPENELFKNLIDLDEYGYIVSDENCSTNVKGIYVAGDIRKKNVRQLVTAVSDGAVAVNSYLSDIE